MKKIATLATVAAIMACTGSNHNGTATVTGTVGGRTLSVAEALSTPIDGLCQQVFGNFVGASGLGIWISNVAGTCGLNSTCSVQANTVTLALAVWVNGSSGSNITVNTYPVYTATTVPPGAQFGAFAAEFETDLACALTPVATASGGSVTVTSVNGSAVAGSFTLVMSDGSNVSGSFNTVSCVINTAPICSGSFGCTGPVQCS
ncbi:MAG TPA: hypothetical protein VMK12_03735 [Anaeromyxobacteraceae bacterium]|nr:hypothetical protein [Anaeromyxobacteraceae bacterium]